MNKNIITKSTMVLLSLFFVTSISTYASEQIVIKTQTNKKKTAGTNDRIKVKIYGSLNETKEFYLDNKNHDDFQSGKIDTFTQDISNKLGDIRGIEITLEDRYTPKDAIKDAINGKAGQLDGWLFDWIEVRNSNNKKNKKTFWKTTEGTWLDDKTEDNGRIKSKREVPAVYIEKIWDECNEDGKFTQAIKFVKPFNGGDGMVEQETKIKRQKVTVASQESSTISKSTKKQLRVKASASASNGVASAEVEVEGSIMKNILEETGISVMRESENEKEQKNTSTITATDYPKGPHAMYLTASYRSGKIKIGEIVPYFIDFSELGDTTTAVSTKKEFDSFDSCKKTNIAIE
jgi:hypothetical protein